MEALNSFRKDSVVDKEALREAGFIRKIDSPVKILGKGDLSKSLTITADRFSKSAKKKISEAGGQAKTK